MSKKLIYIRTIIIIICLIFIGAFVFLLNNIQKSSVVNETIVQETVEETVVFDLSKPPREQRKKFLKIG